MNINSLGNTIKLHGYSRPFETGILVTGSWLNVYVHTMWMSDLYTAIDVNEGAVMGGPAKFIDVNFYGTHEREQTKAWTIFFKSLTRFMEQVELIHCTFIGAQFIYMDGSNRASDAFQGTTPVYDMVIDHNYINVVDTFQAPEAKSPDKRYSGIYMHLPPACPQDGVVRYSRDIRFTNNSCTGRAPADGAFFYVEGMCRGITFSHNDISSPLSTRCIAIRPLAQAPPTHPESQPFHSMQDVKITDNYFRTWMRLMEIGAPRFRRSPARFGAARDHYQ